METPLFENAATTPLNEVLNSESISWACSWGYISAIVGTFFWGLLADRYGRKVTGHLTMLPYLISWIVLLAYRSEMALMLSRILGGLGASGAAVNSPMYVSEIGDHGTTAVLSSMFVLMYNLGVLYVYVFAMYVGYATLNTACLAVSVLFVGLWFNLPDSPTSLIRRGHDKAAVESLKWFRATDNEKELEAELTALKERSNQSTKAEWSDYMAPATVKAMLVGVVFQAGTQLSGINVILMYTVDIFKKSGSTMQPDICTMLVGVVQVIGSVIASCTVNRAGRKFFLISTYLLTAGALITIGTCFYVNRVDPSFNTGILPVLSLSLHVLAFSVGVGTTPYIVYSEIFPPNVRNVCMSVLMFWNNTLGFGIIKAYPLMLNTLHISGCFWMFGAACLLIAPYTYFCIPETRGKSAETIRESLLKWFPDRKSKAMVPELQRKHSIRESQKKNHVCEP